jgi:hypothetical protein
MKRVPGPVHAVAVTSWRESRARRWTTALPTAQGYGQPLRGAAVAHRLPTSFAFGLTRRCASCPNDTHHRSFPRHRYSHRYTLPIYNGSTRFALPIPGCFRLIPELEKTDTPYTPCSLATSATATRIRERPTAGQRIADGVRTPAERITLVDLVSDADLCVCLRSGWLRSRSDVRTSVWKRGPRAEIGRSPSHTIGIHSLSAGAFGGRQRASFSRSSPTAILLQAGNQSFRKAA